MASEPPRRRRRRSAYQRIVRCAELGMGVKLTANEVLRLSLDDAISTAAANDDEHWDEHTAGKCEPGGGCPWCAEEQQGAIEGRR